MTPTGLGSFSRDALVQTDHGTVRLDTLMVLVEEKRKYLPAILTLDESKAEMEWEELLWVGQTACHRPTVELHRIGSTLTMTLPQQVYTFNRGWVEAGSLTHEDELAAANEFNHMTSTNSFEITPGQDDLFLWSFITSRNATAFVNGLLMKIPSVSSMEQCVRLFPSLVA